MARLRDEDLYVAARAYMGKKKKRRAAFLAGARWAESRLEPPVWAPEFVAFVQKHSPYRGKLMPWMVAHNNAVDRMEH